MSQPNLLFIMPDQLRHDFLSCYGATFIQTPHIDSLAEQGVLYQRAYSPSPLCVPARASLLTGRNAIQNGVTDNGQWLREDLAECGIHTWPELLSAEGYYTAAIGKMHFYPWDRHHGFQYKVAAEDKRWLHIRDDYYHFLRAGGYRKYHGKDHQGYYENKGAILSKLPWSHSVDHFTGQAAVQFIQQYGNESPFAMMVGFPGPHCPYDPNEAYLDEVAFDHLPKAIPAVKGNTPELQRQCIEANKRAWNGVDYTEFTDVQKQKIRHHYAASVKQIDDEVGQILNALETQNLLDNTIIMFASDHGDYLGDHGMIGKGSFYEASIHIPLIVRLPQAGKATVSAKLVSLGDITATLLQFAGCEQPSYMDSVLLPDLGFFGSMGREVIIGMTTGGWMIDDGQWRLSKYSTGETVLFDRKHDPFEQNNLAYQPEHLEKYLALDQRLCQEIMAASRDSHASQTVDSTEAHSLSADPAFGKEGWNRPYPRPF